MNSDSDSYSENRKEISLERVKQYNKEYYAKNKARIANDLQKMVVCDECGSTCSHQHYKRHKKSAICLRRKNKKILLV